MSVHGRVRRSKAALPAYWRIGQDRPSLLRILPPRRLVRMIAAGIRVT